MTRLTRLKKYRLAKGYATDKEFAEFLGVSPSAISEVDKKRNPSVLFHALESKTDINLEWLKTGEGEMLKESKPPKDDMVRLAEKEVWDLFDRLEGDKDLQRELSIDLFKWVAEQSRKLKERGL